MVSPFCWVCHSEAIQLFAIMRDSPLPIRGPRLTILWKLKQTTHSKKQDSRLESRLRKTHRRKSEAFISSRSYRSIVHTSGIFYLWIKVFIVWAKKGFAKSVDLAGMVCAIANGARMVCAIGLLCRNNLLTLKSV